MLQVWHCWERIERNSCSEPLNLDTCQAGLFLFLGAQFQPQMDTDFHRLVKSTLPQVTIDSIGRLKYLVKTHFCT